MLIGKVSELTGATRKAIRHYEAIGLIATPDRRGKYRVYNEHDVQIILMIRRAQELGFSLMELKEVVSRKAVDKELPIDLISTSIDNKAIELTQQAELLMQKVNDLKEFKADVLKTLLDSAP